MSPFFLRWLRLKLRRAHDQNIKTNPAANPLPRSRHPSSSQPTDRIDISRLGRHQLDEYISAIPPPPAYDEQGTIPSLLVGLPREHEIRVLQILNRVMSDLHAGLARRGDDYETTAAITAAIQRGTSSAVITVRKAFLQREIGELDQDIDEACQEVADAVISATAAAQRAKFIPSTTIGAADYFIASAIGTANFITLAAHRAANNETDLMMPHIAAAQLASTAQSVAACISVRVRTGNLILADIPFHEFLPKS